MHLKGHLLYNIILFLALIPRFSYGQDQFFTNVIPPSPEAASLGKFIDHPVSLYTGLPDTQVPLGTFNAGDLSIPIRLSYHAAGLKVEDIDSWTGAGWTLNAGGVLSRTIRGLNDELDNAGWFSDRAKAFLSRDYIQDCTFDAVGDNHDYADYLELMFALAGGIDTQADLYYFSIPGSTGKFVFDQDRNMHLIPRQKVTISHPFDVAGSSGWHLTDTDGTQYFFGETSDRQTTYFEEVEVLSDNCKSGDTFNHEQVPNVTAQNSWPLVKIVTSDRQNHIFFEYKADITSYTVHTSETDYFRYGNTHVLNDPAPCVRTMRLQTLRLHRIYNNQGDEVLFEPIPRTINEVTGVQALHRVIFRRDGYTLKTFDFEYIETPTRWFLKKIVQTGADGTSLLYRSFNYYRSGTGDLFFPDRFSHAQDHWSFYNGKTLNNTLIPEFDTSPETNHYGDRWFSLPGANREPDVAFNKLGVLQRINYPTGGWAKFNYELNSYSNFPEKEQMKRTESLNIEDSSLPQEAYFTLDSARYVFFRHYLPDCNDGDEGCVFGVNGPGFSASFNGDNLNSPVEMQLLQPGTYRLRGEYEYSCTGDPPEYFISANWYETGDLIVNKYGGGLRINNIEKSSGEQEHYQYTVTDTQLSSGRLVSNPSYNYKVTSKDGKTSSVGHNCLVNTLLLGDHIVRPSTSQTTLGTTRGAYLGYDEVSVMQRDPNGMSNGKRIQTFTNTEDITGTVFPFSPNTSFDYKNGLPLVTRIYDADGNLLKKVTNRYGSSGFESSAVMSRVLGEDHLHPCETCDDRSIVENRYQNHSEVVLLEEVLEENRTGPGILSIRTQFTYNSHLQESLKKITLYEDSDSEDSDETDETRQLVTEYSYLETDHRYNELTEEYTYLISSEQNSLRTARRIQFENFVTGGLRPRTIETAQNVSLDQKNAAYEVSVTFNSYGSYGNITSLINRSGQRKEYVWDASGKYLLTELINGETEKNYNYDVYGNIEKITDENNISIHYRYDGFHRLTLIKDNAENILRKFNYNLASNVDQ